MTIQIEPVEVQSLKDACITRLEGLILSGEIKIGQRLPPERDLAEMLNVSRPVVHESLVEMEARGLVNIAPRKGVFVNDFRTFGSVALLESLLAFQNGQIDTGFREDLCEFRLLLECETALQAARHSSAEQLASLEEILRAEQETLPGEVKALTELDFKFHHGVALASGNMVYPLIISSFKSVYTHLTGLFFSHNPPEIHRRVFQFHTDLISAIRCRDETSAAACMNAMLIHGAQNLPH
mgnify:CR=1 FL=1